jgi:hypothetical protein
MIAVVSSTIQPTRLQQATSFYTYEGIDRYLNYISYLIIEVSFKEYYFGQPLFLDIANYLSNYKFNIHVFGQSTPVGKELWQIDVLFKRN